MQDVEHETHTDATTGQLAAQLTAIHAILGDLLSNASSHDMLELAMAAAISPRIVPTGPPLWLLVVGPASLGKTVVADLLRETHGPPLALTQFVNQTTQEAFLSGARDQQSKRFARPFLEDLNGRCWINTELNALLSEDDRKVQKILGNLAAAFDGHYSKAVGSSFGPSSVLEVKSRFGLVGCVTPETLARHHQHMVSVGARFLNFRVPRLTQAEEERGMDLLDEEPEERATRTKTLQTRIRQHLSSVLRGSAQVAFADRHKRLVRALARLVAIGRTRTSWETVEDESGTLHREPIVREPEGPFRVRQQIDTLLRALTLIQGQRTPGARALRLVRQVALSSALAGRAEVLAVLQRAPTVRRVPVVVREREGTTIVVDEYEEYGLTVQGCARATHRSPDRARQLLGELVRVGLLIREPNIIKDQRGAPQDFYKPVEWLENILWDGFEPWDDPLDEGEIESILAAV